MADRVTVEVDSQRLSAAVQSFTRGRLPAIVDMALRKVALDVVNETTRGIGGDFGLIKRVDTGRYRAGWRAGLAAAQPRGAGSSRTIEVANTVEYGPHVEFGTRHMAPGLHLTRALRVVAQQVPSDNQPDSLRREIREAWTRG